MMAKAEGLASGTFYLTVMQASQYAAAFAFYVVVARILSPSEVGSFSLLLMVLAVFNTLTLLALNNAAMKYVSESMGAGDAQRAASASSKAFRPIVGLSPPALALGLASFKLIKPLESGEMKPVKSVVPWKPKPLNSRIQASG
jgi:O-antigen/teichoic acid export membrane protein